jgi:hypothetical protein
MAKLVEIKTKDGDTILMQISERDTDGVRPVTSLDEAYEKSAQTFEDGLKQLESVGQSFLNTLSPLAKSLDTAELELGLQATSTGRLFVVEAEVQASLKAKLIFKFNSSTSP